ncbi:MAG: alpha/beta hydrolase [Candidatus Omnitrophota bacterium]
MIKIILFIVVFFIIVIGYVRHLEFSSLYYPAKQIAATPQSIGLDYQDLTFETGDHEKINAWFIPVDKTAPVVYFLHGNAGNIGDRLSKISFFHSLGISVFVIDYRGYGKSTGRPSERGIYADALAGYRYLIDILKVPDDRIILYGESLGGAVAIDLAAQVPIGGLVVEGSFTCAADMAKKIYPFLPVFLVASKYDSYAKVAQIKAPKLFIHSSQDEIVPFVLGRKLFDRAVAPKEFFQAQGGHNDCFFVQSEQIKMSIVKFLEKCGLSN